MQNLVILIKKRRRERLIKDFKKMRDGFQAALSLGDDKALTEIGSYFRILRNELERRGIPLSTIH